MREKIKKFRRPLENGKAHMHAYLSSDELSGFETTRKAHPRARRIRTGVHARATKLSPVNVDVIIRFLEETRSTKVHLFCNDKNVRAVFGESFDLWFVTQISGQDLCKVWSLSVLSI